MHENDMNSCNYSQFYEDSEFSRNGFHNGHTNDILNGLKNHSPSELSASTFEEETLGRADANKFMSDPRRSRPSRPSTPLSPPPLPPHSCPGVTSASSSQSLSHSSSDGNSRDESASKSNLRYDSKEAIRLITSTIDGQINSVSEMLAYFTKLVKAERAVQQALSDLCLDVNDNHSTYRPSNGIQRFLSGRRRGRSSATTSTQSLSNIISTDTELNKILQNLVSSTNQKARAYSTRALFHKLVTVGQLESLITCHQCLKRTYVEFEGELDTQASQYVSNLKRCEKKYMKYADQLTGLRAKLTGLCDKRTSYNRKTMEALMSNLELTTRKLHLLHNDYLMAISTANHYQQWLHTHLRPCLINGIERTMQLACEVVWHLLVFGGEGVQDSNWFKELQSGRSLTSVMEQNNVKFPAQVHHQFNYALLERVPASNLSPSDFVVNDQTRQSFVDLFFSVPFCFTLLRFNNAYVQIRIHVSVNNYRNKELLHRETVEQVTRECIQWEEALAQWRAVFASPLPNPWPPTLRGPMIGDSSASSVMNSNSRAAGAGTEDVSDLHRAVSPIPDIQELWQDDRARPVNLCEVSFRLTICEFELCFATCLAEAHAQLVAQLLDAQSRLAPSQRLQTKPTPDTISVQSHNESKPSQVLITSEVCTPRSLVSSPSDGFLSGPRPKRNRGVNSVRQSVSRFRSQFTRSGAFRASLGAGSSRTGTTDSVVPSLPHALSSSNIVIEREYVSQISTPPRPFRQHTLTTTSPPSVRQPVDRHRSERVQFASTAQSFLYNSKKCISYFCFRFWQFNRPLVSQASVPGLQIIRADGTDKSRLSCATALHTPVGEVDINKEPWFHGVLPRAEVERLLQKQGDFLIRQTSKRASCRDLVQNWNAAVEENRKAGDGNGNTNSDRTVLSGADTTVMRMVLSVNWFGHKHFILYGGTQKDSGWRLEEGEFRTIRHVVIWGG
ncbi:Tyrosine-protein kinase [Fasciola gigantica]|uniref:Tyrosine-protein kinase n=1 Tax=Fasciola gigantica TaxID=46835 RepID=A0A504YLD8_FASGI|nr:Tyrosine-protein kinase [Fasciola gigantica]